MRDVFARAGGRRAAALVAARGLGREMKALARQGRLIAGASVAKADSHVAVTRPAREGVVVFVHGFMAAGPVFGPMAAHLRPLVGATHADFTYAPLERFEDVARRLSATVEKLRETRRTPVALVGHSLGGLVCRWYLQELGGADGVERVVTIATPHAGTRAARFGVGDLAASLRPGSAIIDTLRQGRGRASGVRHTAIVAGADRMVTPPSSAAQLDDARVHWIEGLGHNEALFDTRVFDLVRAALLD